MKDSLGQIQNLWSQK